VNQSESKSSIIEGKKEESGSLGHGKCPQLLIATSI